MKISKKNISQIMEFIEIYGEITREETEAYNNINNRADAEYLSRVIARKDKYLQEIKEFLQAI